MFAKLKLLLVVLQKGSELDNAALWKNTQAAIAAIGALLAALVAFVPFEVPETITAGIAAGVVGAVQLVQLYFTFATSKRVGLPAHHPSDSPAGD